MTPKLTFPLLAAIGATRGMAGIGLGLLLADRIPRRRRTLVGKILFGIGAASTIPLLATVIRRSRLAAADVETAGVMTPNTQIYTPATGTVDDAELVETPQHPETVILPERP